MAIALGTSAAHPLYLYIVFVACMLGAIALLISGWISHRRSSWPRYWQTQSTHRTDVEASGKAEPAYPVEPTPVVVVTEPPAKKTTARKSTTSGTTRTAAKKTTAKKTTPRKTS